VDQIRREKGLAKRERTRKLRNLWVPLPSQENYTEGNGDEIDHGYLNNRKPKPWGKQNWEKEEVGEGAGNSDL